MTSLRFESPLSWPEWIAPTPRAGQRSDHGFPQTLTLTESLNYLDQELKEMRAGGVLYTDIDQPLVERLRKKVGSRTGACLHLQHFGSRYVLACDRWLAVEHNVYALHLTLRQWRNMERWGVATLPMLLKGFEPGGADVTTMSANTSPLWMDALGLGPAATVEDAVAVYHRRAKLVAQDTDALSRLNQAMDEARDYFAARKV